MYSFFCYSLVFPSPSAIRLRPVSVSAVRRSSTAVLSQKCHASNFLSKLSFVFCSGKLINFMKWRAKHISTLFSEPESED